MERVRKWKLKLKSTQLTWPTPWKSYTHLQTSEIQAELERLMQCELSVSTVRRRLNLICSKVDPETNMSGIIKTKINGIVYFSATAAQIAKIRGNADFLKQNNRGRKKIFKPRPCERKGLRKMGRSHNRRAW